MKNLASNIQNAVEFSFLLSSESYYLHEIEEGNVKKHRIQVMTDIALREGAVYCCCESPLYSLFCFCVCLCLFTLSLSFFISFTVSVRCCSVQCRVWPHVLWTGNYVNTILLVMLLLHCHFFTSRSVYTVTAWYYGQSRQWVDLLQFQKLSTYIHTSVFLTLRHLDPYCT